MLRVLILPLNFSIMGIFSPKFCNFRREFLDKKKIQEGIIPSGVVAGGKEAIEFLLSENCHKIFLSENFVQNANSEMKDFILGEI